MSLFFALAVVLLLALGVLTGGSPAPISPQAKAAVAPAQQPQGGSNNNGYVSDGSITGALITADPATWPGSNPIWNICTAVALAEGYNLGPGTAPYDLNNPGDLSPGDEAGQATAGPPQTHGGSEIIFFNVVEGGFLALYIKFNNIVNGRSGVYPATWTWAQVGNKYAGDAASWVANVTTYLGVDPASTPAAYVAGNPAV